MVTPLEVILLAVITPNFPQEKDACGPNCALILLPVAIRANAKQIIFFNVIKDSFFLKVKNNSEVQKFYVKWVLELLSQR
jgi:hypothetical protein